MHAHSQCSPARLAHTVYQDTLAHSRTNPLVQTQRHASTDTQRHKHARTLNDSVHVTDLSLQWYLLTLQHDFLATQQSLTTCLPIASSHQIVHMLVCTCCYNPFLARTRPLTPHTLSLFVRSTAHVLATVLICAPLKYSILIDVPIRSRKEAPDEAAVEDSKRELPDDEEPQDVSPD